MRPPELSEPEAVDDMPPLVRRFLFLAAAGSVLLAVLAAYIVAPGVRQWLHQAAPGFTGERDKALVSMTGLPLAVTGLIAAWQGWSGLPRRAAQRLAIFGAILNTAVLLGAGIPALLEYLHNNT